MKESRAAVLLRLFWTFFKIGPSTFGGGYAMIPVIEREAVEKRKWLDAQELSDMLSVAGSSPGGVGVNASAFIGYRLAGIAGAVAAVLGIALPTFLIALGLGLVYRLLDGNPKAEAAMLGIQGAILALILVSAYKMAKASLFDKTTISIFICTLTLMTITSFNPVIAVAAGMAAGIVCIGIKTLMGRRVSTEKKRTSHTPSSTYYLEYYI